jgi:hypothetical protein
MSRKSPMLARSLNDEVSVVIVDRHLDSVAAGAVVVDSVVEVILAAEEVILVVEEEILVVEEEDLASVAVQAQAQAASVAALVVAVALAIAVAEVGHLVAAALVDPLVIAEVVVTVV